MQYLFPNTWSLTMASSNSKQLHKSLHEIHWLLQITQLVEPNNLQTALQTPTSIFKLPHSITNNNPQSYFPHHIAFGPYHHFRNDLYQIQLYNLHNTISATDSFQLPQPTQIVQQLKQLDIKIRSCFDNVLEIGPEALAWIMLIDGLFFIQLLPISNNEKYETRRLCPHLVLPSAFPSFVDQKLYSSLIDGNWMTQDEIVKDILKLQNQIPLLVLKHILPHKFGDKLDVLFFKFCDFVSPKRLPCHDIPEFMGYRGYTDLSKIFDQSHHYLLHFLYLLILDTISSVDCPVGMALCSASLGVELLNVLASVLQIAFLQQLREAVGLIKTLFGLLGRVGSSSPSTGQDMSIPPLIPSATELQRVGVKLQGNYQDFCDGIKFVEIPKV